jgi:TetR/AcrR family transcriptional regulator of autoinduction and epiphytic fitness
MSELVKTRRRYESSSRQAAAAETRTRILTAARDLFLTRGFAATGMIDVADQAGVAVQTVYTAVGGKAVLLQRVMDFAIAGDNAPTPVRDRPDILAVRAEPDGHRKLVKYARHLCVVHERSAELEQVIRAAADADPEIRQVLHALDAQRVSGMRLFAEHLATARLLRRGMTVTKAADVLATHMDSRIYLWLVHDRRWSSRDYENWYVQVTAAMLLRPTR